MTHEGHDKEIQHYPTSIAEEMQHHQNSVATEPADPKPGLKTTEFWATVGAALLTVAVGGGWLTAGESQEIAGATAQTYVALTHLVTALAPLAASVIYTWSRTRVKTQS